MIKEVSKPKNAIRENSLIFNGHLNVLFFVLHLYLKIIRLKFTKANAMKINAFVRFATNSISPIDANAREIRKIKIIAGKGVCVLLLTELNNFGKDPCFAIP